VGGGPREAAHLERLSRVTGLKIRRASDHDLAAIARIELASFTDAWSVSDFRSVMNAAPTIFLVAVEEKSDEVAGYIVILAVLDEAEVLNIAVDPARRGSSVGSGLLDAGLREIEAVGATAIFLEVRESNEAARRLYASRGFSEISRRRRYYRDPVEDALVLRRAVQG